MMSSLAVAAGQGAGTANGSQENPSAESPGVTSPQKLPAKRDYRDQPFRVAVAFGASITAGGEATSPELDWVSLLANLINEAQFDPIKMYNNGIGANVTSPRSFHYKESFKPSGLERYQDHVIDYHPDLFLMGGDLATNDARGGSPLLPFLEDTRHIILDVQKQTGALTVVNSMTFFTAFDRYAPFNHADLATVRGFNAATKQMAEECGALFVDVFGAQDMASWTVDPKDGVHLNNLGHRLVANRTFEILARNCSCLAIKANALRKAMKEWRPTRELELKNEFYEKRKKEGAESPP